MTAVLWVLFLLNLFVLFVFMVMLAGISPQVAKVMRFFFAPRRIRIYSRRQR